MRKYELAAGIALLIGLGGCGGTAGNNGAAVTNGAVQVENAPGPAAGEGGSADNGLAAAGNASAAAPAGPCPYPNRGWRAVVEPGQIPGQLQIALTGEIRNDRTGRAPMVAFEDTPPPTIFLDIYTEGSIQAEADADTGRRRDTVYYAYRPGHNMAVIRCNGREVARVPIPPPRAR